MAEFAEPEGHVGDVAALLAGYLRAYREVVIGKVEALDPAELRVSRLPSGWSPIELVNHLAFMERRWLVWGFLGEAVDLPWGDDADGRWHVDGQTPLSQVVGRLRDVGHRTDVLLAENPLDRTAALGGRFAENPPTLGWICLHVLQEYARHAGHLDIAVELAGGPTGE
ncbi:MAG: DUF664 domain-containing protein [Nocardioidaceae bacterium]